jgi:hypothetical protein
MSTQEPPQQQPTEEELRQAYAAYEAQLKRIQVDDVIVQTIATVLDLGARRTGLAQGTADERDLQQVRQAIEAVRALLPLVEQRLGPDAGQLRQALSQLQLAYARLSQEEGGGAPPEGAAASGGEPAPEGEPAGQQEGPGPAQRSGRLWVPGQ